MGVLLGGFVSTSGLEGATSYLAFIAPGLAAAQAMQTAAGETTFPVMGCLKWHRTYYAMTRHAARDPPTWWPRTCCS